MKKRLLIAGGSILVLLIVVVAIMTNGLSEGKNITLNGVNLFDIQDGSYIGVYESGRWSNTVNVQVKGGKIMAIDIVDDVFGAQVTNCSDEVFRRVLEAQNTKVDAVSGATVTSKAYLKAIEDAFDKEE